MNEFVYKLALDLNCAKTPPVICSGQFDKGRKFEFTITANGEPYDVTGCSAVLKGVRTDGSHFAVECTVSNGKITKTLDDTTLSVRGKTVAKLVISDSTKSYSTQMFIIDVDSALEGNITVDDDYSILNRLIEQIHSLNESGAIIIDDIINSDSNNAVANSAVATAFVFEENSVATAITVTMQSDSYCTKTGKVVSNTSFTCTQKISLADYSPLSITSAYGYQAPLVVFFDDNDNLLSYDLLNESGVVKVTEQIINIPTSATTAIVNHANNTPVISVSGIKTEVVTIGQKLSDLITELSPLKGKSLYVDGDSIANGAGSGNYAFGEFLRDKYDMSLTKGAVNGATLLADDAHTNSICNRILQLTGEYDYIIFDGGINDVSQSLPLGSKTYHYNGGYDTTTTLGALEQICYYLVTNYFDSKKLFIIVHKILEVDNPVVPTKEGDMFNAIKEVLQKWGIPCVNIYNTNLGAFNSVINNAYFKLNSYGAGDRVHPTKEAYEKFYMPLIEAKIKNL